LESDGLPSKLAGTSAATATLLHSKICENLRHLRINQRSELITHQVDLQIKTGAAYMALLRIYACQKGALMLMEQSLDFTYNDITIHYQLNLHKHYATVFLARCLFRGER
jgi:hypothetical protein